MKFANEYVEDVGKDGKITMREPSPEGWSTFMSDKFPLGKSGKVSDRSGVARCNLFDAICTAVENLEDDLGPITLADLSRIPARLKNRAIFKHFEKGDDSEEEEKN